MSQVHYNQLTASQDSPSWTLTPEEILQQAKEIVADDISFNDGIASIKEPTVENVLMPSINYENENSKRANVITFYQYVSTDKQVRDASTQAEQIMDESSIEQSSRQDLFEVYNKLWEKIKDEPSATDEESLKYLEKVVKAFKRSGLGLPQDKQDEVKKLKIELSNLSTAFAKNTNEENGFITFTKEKLDGVPDSVLEQFETIEENGVTKFKITFKYPDILPVLKYSKNQETRKAAYLANSNKVPENAEILEKIIRVRFKVAKLLGYKTFSEFVLEERMAKSQDNVMGFLTDLKKKLQPLAKIELDKLLEFKNQDLTTRGLPQQESYYAWDNAFYDNLLLEKEYQVDHQKISEYFPLDQTINNMLSFYETLFDVKFVREEHPDPETVWHEDVLKIAVYQNIKFGEPKAKFMGWILFDLHPREGKYTHAAHFGLNSAFIKSNGTRSPNYSALVCNFTKPTKSNPSLLKHSEVTTFFHELGHGVHNLLSQTKHVRFQGTHVPRDFVECPSQMLEFWTWSKNELKKLSGHYQTGEPIPDSLIANLIRTKHVNTGLSNCRQLHFGLFDMALHTIDSAEKLHSLNIKTLWNSLREEVTLLSNGGNDNVGYATFGHIAGGYESGYYGYLYSQVFATDIYYTHFKADPMNVKSGLKYRDIILKNGGAKEILEILEELLGRKPNSDAFFKEILG
ncbi:hypothetical protein JCM33374_g153 [Metschnikowia sp. JCM 33374]|nr:hypothetical protein JCM33374_g153 [Metschnikowia sp. JCM 33374]